MSSLGFHNLFNRASSFHGVRVARFFLEKTDRIYSPDAFIPQKMDIFSRQDRLLKGFDALFFSVSFELDYINILKMLSLSSIPPLVSERKMAKPLIIVGGITVTANPYILSVFSDIVFTGDMDGKIEEILNVLTENNFQKNHTLLERLSGIEGVFIHGRTYIPVRSITDNISRPAHSVVLTGRTSFSNMFLIEIVRGCRSSCAFCMTRCASGPVRIIQERYILDRVDKALRYTSRVGLIGPVLTDNDCLTGIVRGINEAGGQVSFSSLRADDFNEGIAGLLVENRQNTVTFAPETGSRRLRKRIGKTMTDESLLKAVSIAVEHGIKRFRYYIMYGLPEEKMEDIKATAEIVNETVRLFKNPGCRLHLSINPFVPKKGTPLETERIYPEEYYLKMQEVLRNELNGTDCVSLRFDSLRYFYIHCLLSTGDADDAMSLYNYFIKGTISSFGKYAMEKLLR